MPKYISQLDIPDNIKGWTKKYKFEYVFRVLHGANGLKYSILTTCILYYTLLRQESNDQFYFITITKDKNDAHQNVIKTTVLKWRAAILSLIKIIISNVYCSTSNYIIYNSLFNAHSFQIKKCVIYRGILNLIKPKQKI